MNPKSHWEQVYQTKSLTDVSWYQTLPSLSLKLIASTGIQKGDGIIDVGGGASVLVDCLLNAGYQNVAILDISAAAIQHAKDRLGQQASAAEWHEADITTFRSPRRFAVWHDRAVFHFLTNSADRRNYVGVLKETLIPNGHLIIATFAATGPLKCSGLDVMRYDAKLLCAEIGDEFALLETHDETHTTPWDTEQKFIYCRFQRRSNVSGKNLVG
jgi:2-polyprenyl-3-methyl-5-hydroxy-6-metoxy-1,4-benzoquinol methylase